MAKQFLVPPVYQGRMLKQRVPQAFGSPWYVYGHSLTTTIYNNTDATWIERVRRELDFGFVLHNGIGGFTVQDVANILLSLGGETALQWGRYQDSPWTPGLKGVVTINAGGNEIIQAANDGLSAALSTRAFEGVRENLRAIFSGLTCGNHDEVRYANGWNPSGDWTESQSQDQASGRNWLYTTVYNNTISKGGFAAGDYYVFLRSLEGSANVSGSLDGGVADILVNGVVQHAGIDTNGKSYDLAGGSHLGSFGWIARKVTVPAGGTITVKKVDNTARYVVVDFVAPVLAAGLQPVIYYFLEYMHILTKPGLNASYRSAIAPVLAEFPQVNTVDMASTYSDNYVGADGIHLNDMGEAWLAELFIDALARTLPWTEGLHNSPTNLKPFGQPVPSTRNSGYMPQDRDHGMIIQFTSTGTGTQEIRLPDVSRPVPVGWYCYVKRYGTAPLVINANGMSLHSPNGRTDFKYQYSMARITKVGTTHYQVEWFDSPDGIGVDEALMIMGGL